MKLISTWGNTKEELQRHMAEQNAERKREKEKLESGQSSSLSATTRRSPNGLWLAFKTIMDEGNSVPRYVQVDNEFDRGGFKEGCLKLKIKLIAVLSHQSFTQGRVERMNREIRRKTKAGFIRNNDLVWFKHLQSYVDNINNQKSTRKGGMSPNETWSKGYSSSTEKLDEKQKDQAEYINKRAKAYDKRERKFHEGDIVRVKLTAYLPKMRKAQKSNFGWNTVAVHWSPDLYRVKRAIQYPDYTAKQDEYILETHSNDGDPITVVHQTGSRANNNRARKFRASDMTLVSKSEEIPESATPHIDPLNARQALYLNRIIRNK